MRHRPKQRGFTIIEVLIFLSISGFVFAAGIGQYSAQQRRVNFATGVRNMQADIISMQSEVRSSYTPDLGTGYCANPASSTTINAYSFGTSADNQECVFLGKAFAFGGPGAAGDCTDADADKCSHYDIIPIIGKRQYVDLATNKTKVVDSYANAQPLALLKCTSVLVSYATELPCGTGMPAASYPTSTPDLTERKTLPNHLAIYRAFIRNADGSKGILISGFAFVFRLDGSASAADGNGFSVDLATYTTIPYQTNTETLAAVAISGMQDSMLSPDNGITLCVLNGDGRTAAISVGASKSATDVQVEPENNQDSGCTS